MAKSIKNWYKSRTVILAIFQAVLGVVAVFATEYPELGGVVIFKSILDFVLRYVTSKPIK